LYVFAIFTNFYQFLPILYYFIPIFMYMKAQGIGNPVHSAIHKFS
jgi:hypothetical protein